MDDKGPSVAGNRKVRGKRRADDKFGELKRQRRKLKFSYTELTETFKRIYLDTRGQISYRTPTKREPTDWELDGHETNEC